MHTLAGRFQSLYQPSNQSLLTRAFLFSKNTCTYLQFVYYVITDNEIGDTALKQLQVRFPEITNTAIQAGVETFDDVSFSEVARAAMELGLEQLFELNRTQRSTATGAIIKSINARIKSKDKE